MDKEPHMLQAPGSTTLHLSAGVDRFTGFRVKSVCGTTNHNFKSVGPVKFLPADEQRLLCDVCVRHWANQKEE